MKSRKDAKPVAPGFSFKFYLILNCMRYNKYAIITGKGVVAEVLAPDLLIALVTARLTFTHVNHYVLRYYTEFSGDLYFQSREISFN